MSGRTKGRELLYEVFTETGEIINASSSVSASSRHFDGDRVLD